MSIQYRWPGITLPAGLTVLDRGAVRHAVLGQCGTLTCLCRSTDQAAVCFQARSASYRCTIPVLGMFPRLHDHRRSGGSTENMAD